MKKQLAIIISACILLSAATAFTSCNCSSPETPLVQGETIPPDYVDKNGVGYNINDDNTLTVAAADKNMKKVEIPDTYKDRDVTAIGRSSFKMTKAKTATIPNSVTEICDYAFAFSQNLEEVNMGDNVKSIGTNAFSGCTSLKEIKLSDSLESIGLFAFDGSGLETITVPKSVNKIDEYAFAECTELTDVIIENGDVQIAETAFKTSIHVNLIADKNSSVIKFAKENGIDYTEK